ncbi:M23 family metallopeptidase [Croceibacterium aestuarii]|uniref:M23 family metallopeptidase n=1 Tax=Croceibacterium aestuarii TaxID=3064139 RepID=UPI00272DE205|nr:M23 family metallopeptidase [Croceibacterium sp. D39]
MHFNRALRSSAALAAAALAIAASPAVANETAATTTQMTGSLKGSASQEVLGNGDKEFTQLFASWKSTEHSSDPMAAPRQAVSVPSLIPVDYARMSSGFGVREHPVLGGRRAHKGVDLAAPTGTPVYAPADGYVKMASRFGSYGNFIELEHGGEMETRYGHLSGFNVSEGQSVHKGDVIGYVGTTGRSTGPHLHYEVRVAGEAVDPTPYMVMSEVALVAGEGGQGGGDDE